MKFHNVPDRLDIRKAGRIQAATQKTTCFLESGGPTENATKPHTVRNMIMLSIVNDSE
jgi:hypothetical protein